MAAKATVAPAKSYQLRVELIGNRDFHTMHLGTIENVRLRVQQYVTQGYVDEITTTEGGLVEKITCHPMHRVMSMTIEIDGAGDVRGN